MSLVKDSTPVQHSSSLNDTSASLLKDPPPQNSRNQSQNQKYPIRSLKLQEDQLLVKAAIL